MRRSILFSFILFVCIFVFAAGAPCWAANTIKIGVIGPMTTGRGINQWNGAQIAADHINEAGGLKVGNRRMKIELVKSDSNEYASLEDAKKAMKQLLLRDKVDFVTGAASSEAALAMQDIAMENKTIFIGAGAAHPALCQRVAENYKRYKYWFRGTPFNSGYLVQNLFAQVRSVTTDLKKNLNIDRVRIAIVAENAIWVNPMVKKAEAYLPMMGMDVVGTWRPERHAKDVRSELSAIQSIGCHMILTMISGRVGIPLAKQAGEMKIPAVQVGINVIAASNSFWEETQGMANYVMHQSTYCPDAEYNELTKPFLDEYNKRFNETPNYTAGTYGIIKDVLGVAIEKAGSIDADKVIKALESGTFKTAAGLTIFEKDVEGRHLHELKYGPGYTTSLGIQWQDGKQVAVWPHFKWLSPYWEYSVEPPAQPNKMSYKGLKPYVIPPWVVAAYRK